MKNAFFRVLCLSMALFFSLGVFAISALEASNFVVRENNFLLELENWQDPVVPISNDGKSYWVIPVTSGNDIVTFFPVKVEAKELSVSRAVNRNVFLTADYLRELSIEKEIISKNPSIEWFFTQTYSLRFANMSDELKNETFQLSTIASSLDSGEVYNLSTEMTSILESMSFSSSNLAVLVEQAQGLENDFFSSPDTSKIEPLKDSFSSVFSEISSLNSLALEYRKKVDSLKQVISLSDTDPSTKTYLISLADVPSEFNSIGNYLLDSVELSGQLDSIYKKISSRSDLLLNEFDLRLERQKAFEKLYGENLAIIDQTNGEFSSLSALANYVLLPENKNRWNAKGLLSSLESNWKSAEKLFNERNYALSESFADKAVSPAVNIFGQGFTVVEKPQEPQSGIFLQLAAGLFVLLVVLILFNNRDRLVSFVEKKEDSGGFSSEVD